MRIFAFLFLLASGSAEAALTGFMVGGNCYSTYDQAMSVKFGADPVLITAATNSDKVHFFEPVAGVWNWSEYSTAGAAWTLVYHSPMPVVGFPVCDPGATLDLIDSANISANFLWGFSAIVLFFFYGFVIYAAITVINKL